MLEVGVQYPVLEVLSRWSCLMPSARRWRPCRASGPRRRRWPSGRGSCLACAEKSGVAPPTRVAERTGLSRESPAQNQAQRTGGSLLAALDVHPRVAMAILRHSRIALTMEVYTQVPDKTTRDALERLSDFLGGPQGDAGDPGTDPPAEGGADLTQPAA